MIAKTLATEEYFIENEPFYQAVGEEIAIFEAAFKQKLPILLKGSGLEEGASTRLLVHAARLMHDGISPVSACHCAIAQALMDDSEMLTAIGELSSSLF